MSEKKRRAIHSMLIIAVFIAITFLISFSALNNIKNSTKEQLKDNLQTLLLTVQEAQHILIKQRQLVLESLAESPAVIKLTQEQLTQYHNIGELKTTNALARLRSIIGPVIETFNDHGFSIIAPNTTTIAAMHSHNIGKKSYIAQKKPHLFAKVFQGQNIFIPPIQHDSLALTKQYNHLAMMYIASPIVDESGKTIAVITLEIDPAIYFSTVTILGRIGDTGETYAFDRNGVLLTESRFTSQLRKMNLLKYGEQSVYNTQLRDPGGNLLEGHQLTQSYHQLPLTLMAEQAVAGNNGVNMDGYRDYRGVEVIGAWLWDSEFEFGLATELNINEALAPYYQTQNTLLTVIITTVLLLILMLQQLLNIYKQQQQKIQQVNTSLEQKVKARTADLEQAKAHLSQANIELEALSTTDALTGLANRRYFDNQLKMEWQRCLRDKNTIAIILFDVDCFKQYNDYYGHIMGDNCLKDIASLLKDATITKRPGDVIARYGGEEFIMMLSNATQAYCQQVAHCICSSIKSLHIPHKMSTLEQVSTVTVSVGFVITDQLSTLSPEQLINHADRALYSAKRSGRNCIFEFFEDKGDKVTSIHDAKPSMHD